VLKVVKNVFVKLFVYSSVYQVELHLAQRFPKEIRWTSKPYRRWWNPLEPHQMSLFNRPLEKVALLFSCLQ
jgi:hypothetical protein